MCESRSDVGSSAKQNRNMPALADQAQRSGTEGDTLK